MSTKTTRAQELEAAFIAEVQSKGVAHVLRWIGGWYDRAAMVEVEDGLEASLGSRVHLAEARELVLTDELLRQAESNSNYGSSAGHNLFSQSMVTARAKLLNNRYAVEDPETVTPCSPQGRRLRWDALRAQVKATEEPTSAA